MVISSETPGGGWIGRNFLLQRNKRATIVVAASRHRVQIWLISFILEVFLSPQPPSLTLPGFTPNPTHISGVRNNKITKPVFSALSSVDDELKAGPPWKPVPSSFFPTQEQSCSIPDPSVLLFLPSPFLSASFCTLPLCGSAWARSYLFHI